MPRLSPKSHDWEKTTEVFQMDGVPGGVPGDVLWKCRNCGATMRTRRRPSKYAKVSLIGKGGTAILARADGFYCDGFILWQVMET
jgi:hypothetical protein